MHAGHACLPPAASLRRLVTQGCCLPCCMMGRPCSPASPAAERKQACPRAAPPLQAVCKRYGLEIGAYCAPLVRLLMVLTAPVAWPLGERRRLGRGLTPGGTASLAAAWGFTLNLPRPPAHVPGCRVATAPLRRSACCGAR